MLVDANLLLYAVDQDASQHESAASWITSQLSGDRPVGIPWESLIAFVRISTNPRATTRPLNALDAWAIVQDWLRADPVWVPAPTERHADVLGSLITTHRVGGNLIADAHIAALAIEHGLEVCSADTDFARFTEIRWRNPLSG